MFSAESSGIGATVCTAGRFLLVAPFTKLEDEEEDEDPESTAPVPKIIVFSFEYKLIKQMMFSINPKITASHLNFKIELGHKKIIWPKEH